jgi:hypothetical protein
MVENQIQIILKHMGVDYFNIYSPVTRTTSIRVLFSLSSIYKLYVYQMNVKMTFLNRDLKEKVYMEQNESYTSK